MNNLKEYIIEKLRLNKDITFKEQDNFLIIYNKINNKEILSKIFDDAEDAKAFAKARDVNFLDGYVSNDLDELEKLYKMTETNWYETKWIDIEKYCKEHNIERFLKYIQNK